jgi:hypothetical protein
MEGIVVVLEHVLHVVVGDGRMAVVVKDKCMLGGVWTTHKVFA